MNEKIYYNAEEIAAMLGTNAKAVDNAVCRIKKKIKKLV